MTSVDTAVLDIVSTVLNEPVAGLRAQPVLASYDWDSLASLEVLSQLENRLGVTLDLRRYHNVRTLENLIDLVAAAVAAKTVAGRR
jgi:acyl carrier protein